MKKRLIRALSLVIILAVLLSTSLSAIAVNDSDSGVEIKTVPYQSNGTIFIPLRSVLESFGAEVIWKGSNRINVIYRDIFIDMIVGEKKITVNQEEKELSAAPITAKNMTMVPLQFIEEYFDAQVELDAVSGFATIALEDDGALSDLSFLTGSISKPRAGNSYYRWSMDIPRGSRVSSVSFNSKYVLIDNEHRGVILEVWVDTDKGEKLEDYYREIVDNTYEILGSDVVESSLNTSARLPYAEFVYSNLYDEAVCRRIYAGRGYMYNIMLTSYMDTDPRKFKDNAYYKGIMDSFSLGYNSDSRDVQDLSKVKFGMARHENFITLENGMKVYTWSLSVPPEWEVVNPDDTNRFYTKLGLDKNEYISIEINKTRDVNEIRNYVEGLKAFYDENFNPEFYEFVDLRDEKISDFKSGRIVYNIKSGSRIFTYDESYFVSGSLIYCITIKAPQEKYENQADDYYKIIDTFKVAGNDTKELETDIDKHDYNIEKNFMGKDDNKVLYESKAYSWSIKLPGYWARNNPADAYTQSFSNYGTGAIIGVEAVENTEQSKELDDLEKFGLMQYAANNSVKFEGVETLREKGTSVKLYKFRMENEDADMYADFRLYIMSKGRYSYCYLSAIPDVCTSEKNMVEMQEIWSSFAPSGK